MATIYNFIFLVALIGSFLSNAQSLICSSQSFKNRSFTHCEDLPHLDAFLHWTYNPKNSSLSVAFLAPPPHSMGWIAWAVNPTDTGMVGAQALIATLTGDAPSVCTYDISSHSSILPSTLSFPVWDLAAEFSGDQLTIFANLKVPEKAKWLNQVWQVGPTVDPESGAPEIHEFTPANLNAKSVLVFDNGSNGAMSPASAPPLLKVNQTIVVASAPAFNKSGVSKIERGNFKLVLGIFLLIWGIFLF